MNEDLNNLVIQIRRDILRMVHDVNSGHPGGSLGCVEFFVTLYKRILNISSDKMTKDFFHSSKYLAFFSFFYKSQP